MKILVATAMYPSDAQPYFGTFVRTQVQSLRAAGMDVEVFVLTGRSRKWMYVQAVSKLRSRLALGDVDLVHAHYSYVGFVALLQRYARVVVTFHGDDLQGSVARGGALSWTALPVRLLGQLVARRADAVVVQNKRMAQLSGRRDAYVIPHEVDFSIFHPVDRGDVCRQLGLDPSRRRALFAANPAIPVKRFELAKAAVDRVNDAGLELELIVVHDQTQQILAKYMNICDVLVFPSYQEGSPNVVKQAMACNLPIVAADVGDIREVIGQTADCHICNPDAITFAEAIAKVVVGGRRTRGYETMGRYSPDSVVARLMEMYGAVVSRNRNRSQIADSQLIL